MALTVGTHLAIPSLIGRGMTEGAARSALTRARIFGSYPAQIGIDRVVPISYSYANHKFTIGAVH
jgi:hypothetical protein